ncbi:restriction endonuclease [Sulfurimonas crateris]|uniref:Restriction endonuclease n=1 Tax=Sulfurimonas crateris TaxID=2574727 RepID=A0A4U2Z8K9_9BACT|nr:restriction endonuclease [Sulfurimonas crateris]TKI70275.1 restriction endonuclease [Sulfurimonas crateris]
MSKVKLTIEQLQKEAKEFAEVESIHNDPELYGVTDGKAVGTYLEHKFQAFLHEKYDYVEGSSAKGMDFPELYIDMKVTSIKQPQSSSPFKSARQKIYGLGYALLIFVYDKTDNQEEKTGRLKILHTVYVEDYRTGDFQTTTGLKKILENDGNIDDVLAFFGERMLPLDEIQAQTLAEEVIGNPPEIGYLTISNALQWRLQYSRVIQKAGEITGIQKVL